MRIHLKMNNSALSIITFLIICCYSCKDEGLTVENGDYIVFGHFNGYCTGESCVQFFRLESDRLLSTPEDNYRGEGFLQAQLYESLPLPKFEKVKDLPEFIPQELLADPNTNIGQSDVEDIGSVYFEVKNDTMHQYWILELGDFDMPEVYSDFLEKINEKFVFINQ